MADDVKATKAAQDLAGKEGIDLSSVDVDGQITKADVEQVAAERNEQPELYYLKIAEHVGFLSPTENVSVEGRTFIKGEKSQQNIVTKEEWETKYRYAVGPPTTQFPEGEPLLDVGGKV
jgi:pyruvate/2-oxoglutarate dehydrogenase complex dihydrolipoamide acyltransferase (E2) component